MSVAISPQSYTTLWDTIGGFLGLAANIVEIFHAGTGRVGARKLAMMERDLDKTLCDAERHHIGDLASSIVVENQVVGVRVGEQCLDDAPLDRIGSFFRPLRFCSDICPRPVPNLDPIRRIRLDPNTIGQGIEMAVDQQRAVSEINLRGILTKGFRQRLHLAADLDRRLRP